MLFRTQARRFWSISTSKGGRSVISLAETGLTPKTISEICNGKAPITPATALALEKAFQRPAHLWLNLQLHFDEAEARGRQLAKSLQWSEWVRNFPLKEMKRLNFSLPAGGSDADSLLNFFGVSSPRKLQLCMESLRGGVPADSHLQDARGVHRGMGP